MWLDKRLRCVVDEIESSRATIDVGTDHGKVILTAISEGRTAKGIASDISSESLSKARELASRMGLPLDTRVGDGLSVVSDGEVDTCIIAGMGGKEIVKILSSANFSVPKLILVPHRDARLTREYVVTHGYKIDKDYMIKEGNFFYNIIVATLGVGDSSERALYFGQNDRSNVAFSEYIVYRSRVIREILSKTTNVELSHELELLMSL